MLHSFRHHQTGSIVRCQRPMLLAVLAWLAVAAMLLGNLGVWANTSVAEPQAQSRQLPPDGPGGEGQLEQDPAKLRRQGVVPAAKPVAQTDPGQPLDASFWHQLGHPLVSATPSAAAWPDIDDTLPWRTAPGHRQQRGQAPPQA